MIFQKTFTSHDILKITKSNKAQENYDRKLHSINKYLWSKFTIKDIENKNIFHRQKNFCLAVTQTLIWSDHCKREAQDERLSIFICIWLDYTSEFLKLYFTSNFFNKIVGISEFGLFALFISFSIVASKSETGKENHFYLLRDESWNITSPIHNLFGSKN